MTDTKDDIHEVSRRFAKFTPEQIEAFLQRMQGVIDDLKRRVSEPIAVVGVACRFPGAADTPAQYWENLRQGRNVVTEVPPERWDINAFYDPNPDAPGKMYTRWGGFLRDVDKFDAGLFRIPPMEARAIDPQQRLLLEASWEALEDAGYASSALEGSPTGVFMGALNADYGEFTSVQELDHFSIMGSGMTGVAGRVSWTLGLRGPCVAVDTACATSLVALHMACASLRDGSSNVALAGGVNLMLSPRATVFGCRARTQSPHGRCATFDAGADGYVRGEGCGVLVLKRLSDALADKDGIRGVVRASAVNHNGRSYSVSAPSATAQLELLQRALAEAGVDPSDVDYIEAHGTGTPLGDPNEVEAIVSAYCEGRAPERRLAIGSAKTTMGHLEPASGMAGIIKVMLAMEHNELPPHLNLKEINPLLPFEEAPVSIPTTTTPWIAVDRTRLAGVSSFGMAGTNAHVIVEEPPPRPLEQGPTRSAHLLALSAQSEAALRDQVSHYSAHLAQNPQLRIEDVCFTASVGRNHFAHRLSITASTTTELHTRLQAYLDGQASEAAVGYSSPTRPPRQIAFLFSGQGAQYAGMGKTLYAAEPAFRAALDECAAALAPHLDKPLLDIMFQGGELIDATRYSQPALFALEYSLAQLWRHWGVRPAMVLGHSVGEYAAACVAGALSLADAASLVAARGRLMDSLPGMGGMLVVFAELAVIEEVCKAHDGVSIAVYNTPLNAVLAGPRGVLEMVQLDLAKRQKKAKILPGSHAFHSALMDPILAELEAAAARTAPVPPAIPFVSNVTGTVLPAGQTLSPSYWRQHARQPVRFRDGVQQLSACDVLIEIGPSATLLPMVQECLTDRRRMLVPSLARDEDDWARLLKSVGTVYAAGATIAWQHINPSHAVRVRLPTYAFQRQRYWLRDEGSAAPTQNLNDNAEPSARGPADAALLKRLGDAKPAERGALMEAYVRKVTAELLGDDGATTVPRDKYLVDLGINSLVAMNLRSRMESDLGIPLPLSMLIDHPSIGELADHLADLLSQPQFGFDA